MLEGDMDPYVTTGNNIRTPLLSVTIPILSYRVI